MDIQVIIVTLIWGAVAGWFGAELFKRSRLGFTGNIIVGTLGGFVGYWIFSNLGFNLIAGWVGYILTAAIGAFFLMTVLNLIIPKRI